MKVLLISPPVQSPLRADMSDLFEKESGLYPSLGLLYLAARLLEEGRHQVKVLGKAGLMTTLITSRGCPFSCIYCGRFHIGKRFRARSAHNVVDEMEKCVGMGIGELQVFDDIFTLDKRRALAVCQEVVRRGLKVSWAIRSRVDTVEPWTGSCSRASRVRVAGESPMAWKRATTRP